MHIKIVERVPNYVQVLVHHHDHPPTSTGPGRTSDRTCSTAARTASFHRKSPRLMVESGDVALARIVNCSLPQAAFVGAEHTHRSNFWTIYLGGSGRGFPMPQNSPPASTRVRNVKPHGPYQRTLPFRSLAADLPKRPAQQDRICIGPVLGTMTVVRWSGRSPVVNVKLALGIIMKP
jgi:hypothetical protein